MTLSSTLCPATQSIRFGVGSESRSPRRLAFPREEAPPRAPRSIPAETEDSAPLCDEELLGRYRDERRPGDFVELVRRYSGDLGRYLVRFLGDAALGEDLLQETFLQVHLKCGLYRDGWPARPWLYAVALHRAVDVLRRSRRLPTARLGPAYEADGPASLVELLACDEPGPLEELQERERQQWVRESLARLPAPMRQALELAYYQGLSNAEIAGLLRVPLGTVKSRLHGAIARLRALAERHDRAGRP